MNKEVELQLIIKNPALMIPQEEILINRFHYDQMTKKELKNLIRLLLKDKDLYSEFLFYQVLFDYFSSSANQKKKN